ncbi:MAG: M20/M25/M40 family metallo-hydrolase, partial [Gaiellales bacterium]
MPAAYGTCERLSELTLGLVDVPSVSRDEAEITSFIRDLMPSSLPEAYRQGNDCTLYLTERDEARPLIVLAGHTDTVPAQANLPGRIEDGHVFGLGASDMKGGLAVMIELARWLDGASPQRQLDAGFLFFSREELPVAESPLPALFQARPGLDGAALVVVLEPTDNTIQAGCLGNIIATLTFRGESVHSARPWTGVNAIDRAVEGLYPLVGRGRREVTIDGLEFYEVVSITGINGGIADNVVPDEVTCRVNYRFTPDMTPDEAEQSLSTLVGEAGELRVVSTSPAGAVSAGSPIV